VAKYMNETNETSVRFLVYSWWESSMVRSSQPVITQFLGAEVVTLGLSVGRGEPNTVISVIPGRACIFSKEYGETRCKTQGSQVVYRQ